MNLNDYKIKLGCPLVFQTPEEFANKWNEFVQYCTENPVFKKEAIKRKISRDEEKIEIIDVPIPKPLTIANFCNYCGIVRQTFLNYGQRPDFLDVFTHIHEVSTSQRMDGAYCNLYNGTIVARDLGLKETTETQIKGDDEINIKYTKKKPDED